MSLAAWRRLGPAAFLALATATPTRALATEPTPSELAECNSASESGQRQQRAGKLIAARDHFRKCAASTCPTAIASFCAERISDVQAALPTVIIKARDARGAELGDLDVSINGKVAGKSDGRSITVDPGPNKIRVERASDHASASVDVVIAEGEKLRAIAVTIDGASTPTPTPPPTPEPATRSSISGAGVVVAALGLVSIGAGAVLWSSGLKARSRDLEAGGCSPRCDDSEVSSIRQKLIIGDVLAGVGVVALGIATYLFLRPKAPPPPSRAGLERHDPIGIDEPTKSWLR